MEEYANPSGTQQYFSDINTRIRDLEEKHRLLKDRTLLIGQNLVEDKESISAELRGLKKSVMQLTEENLKMGKFVQRIAEQMAKSARKEELMILQRQFDMLKPHMK